MKTDPEREGSSESKLRSKQGLEPCDDSKDPIRTILTKVKNARFSSGITSLQQLPRKYPEYGPLPSDIHPELLKIIRDRHIDKLYTHQVLAWHAIRRGENLVIVTPTASGKTLCYNLPIIDRLMTQPKSKALYIFPAKALAQDQYHELINMTGGAVKTVQPCIYDGDTSSENRKRIREAARIVLTNPDMIHSGILPHHARWASFFQHLEFIVVDELHQYRGIFGSHLCNVFRRLRRICQFHGSNPRIIMSSATIANPLEFAERLIGEPVHLIAESGAPAGEKVVIFYNPPVIDSADMIRRSYLEETTRFSRLILAEGVQTLIFARSRRNVELLLLELKKLMKDIIDPGMIRGYRGGYLPRERREIESGLRQGSIRCVVATSALELGVDIGNMGAVVMAGYPGTIASTWQRAGRAGRREDRSLAVVIASAAPLDQYIVRNPEYFFNQPAEHALINPDNLLILLAHIRCAAFELPFMDSERYAGLDVTEEFLEYLESSGEVQHSGGRWFYTGGDYPAEKVSLRSVSSQSVIIVEESDENPEVIGEIDICAAHLLLHPEAVYLHGARQFLVLNLDLENCKARIRALDTGYYTAPIEQIKIQILDEKPGVPKSSPVHMGDVKVVSRVIGYKKLRFGTQEQLGTGTVNLPEQELITFAAWFTVPLNGEDGTDPSVTASPAAGLIGALTAIHSVASVLLMSDPRDIGSCVVACDHDWTVQMDHLGMIQTHGQPPPSGGTVNLFIFDRYPGGIGLSEQLFRTASTILTEACNSVKSCECRYGCPGCIGPVIAGSDTVKSEAIDVLEYLSSRITGTLTGG
ncbi:DEAD/DEAH box helicase [bacterium]|nr:DEAD/DEAH box helicase [candidate division CSSED10-310 bacterium]